MQTRKHKLYWIISVIGVILLFFVQLGFRFFLTTHAYMIRIPHLLSIQWIGMENKGISFSLLSFLPYWVLSLLALGFSLLIMLIGSMVKGTILRIGLLCIGIGGCVNALDRLIFHNVYDYLSLTLINWTVFVFNLPDFMISIGFVCGFIAVVFLSKRGAKH